MTDPEPEGEREWQQWLLLPSPSFVSESHQNNTWLTSLILVRNYNLAKVFICKKKERKSSCYKTRIRQVVHRRDPADTTSCFMTPGHLCPRFVSTASGVKQHLPEHHFVTWETRHLSSTSPCCPKAPTDLATWRLPESDKQMFWWCVLWYGEHAWNLFDRRKLNLWLTPIINYINEYCSRRSYRVQTDCWTGTQDNN